MTATTDGADLELTARNRTDYDFPPIAAVIPCFNPGPVPSRNPEFANTNTYFLGPDGLDGVKHIHTQLDQRGNKRTDGPAAVVEDPSIQPVDAVDHLLQVWGNKLIEHAQGNERSRLAPQIADEQVEVDPAAGHFGGSVSRLPQDGF